VELLAYAGDMLSYYQDRVAEEQRLRTRGFAVLSLALLVLFFFRPRRKLSNDY
jgi:hypothetical protein